MYQVPNRSCMIVCVDLEPEVSLLIAFENHPTVEISLQIRSRKTFHFFFHSLTVTYKNIFSSLSAGYMLVRKAIFIFHIFTHREQRHQKMEFHVKNMSVINLLRIPKTFVKLSSKKTTNLSFPHFYGNTIFGFDCDVCRKEEQKKLSLILARQKLGISIFIVCKVQVI